MEFWQLEDQTPQSTKRRHGSSVFTLKEMEEATCSFSEKNLVGKGGFGRVYRGVLRSGEVLLFNRKFYHTPRKKKTDMVMKWLFLNTNHDLNGIQARILNFPNRHKANAFNFNSKKPSAIIVPILCKIPEQRAVKHDTLVFEKHTKLLLFSNL
jgi:hypothetical protein